jgi:CHAT domain-containing protein
VKRRKPQCYGCVLVLLLCVSLSVGSAGEAAGTESSLVLSYFVTEDVTTLSVIGEDGFRMTCTVDVSRASLRERVSRLRQAMAADSGDAASNLHLEFLNEAAAVYALLISPIEAELEGVTRLVIVPSDLLFYVPFGALYRSPDPERPAAPGGQFLVERVAVDYALTVCAALAPEASGYELFSSLVILATAAGADESTAVASRLSQPYVMGANNTPTGGLPSVLADNRYSVVHFIARQLEIDPTAPLLSVVRPDAGMDGMLLRVADLLRSGTEASLTEASLMEARLLTISAPLSFSGSGALGMSAGQLPATATGEELRAVVDALQGGGARSVIVPLSGEVDALAECGFMETFYAARQAGLGESAAFRQAQRDSLRKDAARPASWAGFALYRGCLRTGDESFVGLEKLDNELLAQFQAWMQSSHAMEDKGPIVSVMATLDGSATIADLEAIQNLGQEILVRGTFGVFVWIELPVGELAALVRLSDVRSVSTPAETIPN